MNLSNFATPAASTEYFTKRKAAEDHAVVSFFIVKYEPDAPDRHNSGETTLVVTADVVVHTEKKSHRRETIEGALAKQLKVAPGSIVDGRMGFGTTNTQAIVVDCDAIDADTRANLERFYEINAERTDAGFRLRDKVAFDHSPDVAPAPDATEGEPF